VALVAAAVERHQPFRSRDRALQAALAVLDLQLQYRSAPAVDRDRFATWAQRVISDAAANNIAGVRGDGVTLALIRDRLTASLRLVVLTRLTTLIAPLQAAGADGDTRTAARTARQLLRALSG
jgi:hypothetical protein